jgi:hypothetical protein
MKPMSLTSPESIAREYKGNKKAIANAARMGLVDPTAALMAGMFIDRMRSAASEEQKDDTTVVQDVFNAPMQQQGLPQAPMQAQPQPQQPRPQMAQAQGIPGAQMAAAQPQMAPGVEGLPTGNVGNYADGGIVAFADEGLVQGDALDAYLGQLYPGSAEDIFARLRNNPYPDGAAQDTPEARIDREQTTRELLSQYGVEGPVPFYLTEEDKRKNAKLFNQGEQFKRAAEQREIGRRGAEAAGKEFGLAGIMKGADLNTPFNRLPRAGETSPAMADVLNRRQAMREALRLPGFDTPFNRAAPDVASRDATRSDLPPSVAARPEAAAPAPKVDAYGLPIPDPAANLTLAQQQARSLIKLPEIRSQDDMVAAENKLRRDIGVNENLPKEQIAKFEEERKGLKADKEEAKWTRLIEAGLGVMAGTSPFAAVNIGQGASPALKGFAQDIKDVKKADRELTRAQMALETTENQYKIDKSKSVLDRMNRQEDRRDKAEQTVATTTATLANSLNALSGSQYDARLRDITSRAVSANTLEASKYSADQGLRGSLAYAGATRYAADKDTRSIERIMKDKRVDYTTALGLFYDQRQRDFDRYNSLRNAVNKADDSFASTPFAMQRSNDLAKLDPKKESDKPKIAKIQEELEAAKRKYRLDRGLTQESLDYLKNEDARLRNQSGPLGGNPSSSIPPDAIADLKANPTAQTKAQFDAIFGAGAADRALGQ